MSVDYQAALNYSLMAGELNGTFEELRFSAFPDVKPRLIDNKSTDTQVAAVTIADHKQGSGTQEPSKILVVFRGTDGWGDWATNVQFSREFFEIHRPETLGPQQSVDTPSSAKHIRPVDPDFMHRDLTTVAPRAQMHEGFTKAYISVQEQLHRYIPFQNTANLTVIGHSLGGALATLCAIDFQLTYKNRFNIELYTFGSPRVGNSDFQELFNQHIPRSHRFVNGLDAVPGLLPRWIGYRHVAAGHRIGRWFTWRILSAQVTDHFMRAYNRSLEKLV